MYEYDDVCMMLSVAMCMNNKMMFCHVTILTPCVSLENVWCLRRCIKLLNDESMHLHIYETVELMLKATVEHLLKATVKHINAINIWYHMYDVETLGVHLVE